MKKPPTSFPAYRDWLGVAINRIGTLWNHPDPHESVWEECAIIAFEAGDIAARLGLAELHHRSWDFAGMADPLRVKTFLAECLAAVSQREPSKPPALLLSVDDVANILKVSPSHVYRLTDGAKMPRPVKIGALVRWQRAEFESWVSDGCKSVRQK